MAFLRHITIVAKQLNLPIAILSLDQEKAFKHADWGFLLATLRHMDFGQSFIKWVDLLYTDIPLTGLSPHKVSVKAVPSLLCCMSSNIWAHPLITGIQFPGLPSPLPVVSLYANDTTVVVSSDPATFAVFETYSLFEHGTGSKLNISKCGLSLGMWCNRLDARLDEANWQPHIEAVEKCLNF